MTTEQHDSKTEDRPKMWKGRNVRAFAKAVLHGDDEHKAWLLEAAENFIAGKPLPAPRGKGTAPPSHLPAREAIEQARSENEKADVLKEIYKWTGSAWLSGGDDKHDYRSELYRFLCGLIGWFLPDDAAALQPISQGTGEAVADEAMHQIWKDWFTFYQNHFRARGVAISAADQYAFYEIAQPILRKITAPQSQPEGVREALDTSPGPWAVYVEKIGSVDDAKRELAQLVDGTPDFQHELYMLVDANGLCPAVTGCGKRSKTNAEFIARAYNERTTTPSRGLVEAAECERLAKLIEEYCMERKPGGERIVLAVAASIVRRGRRLTAKEQLKNLQRFMDEADVEESAARTLSAKPTANAADREGDRDA